MISDILYNLPHDIKNIPGIHNIIADYDAKLSTIFNIKVNIFIENKNNEKKELVRYIEFPSKTIFDAMIKNDEVFEDILQKQFIYYSDYKIDHITYLPVSKKLSNSENIFKITVNHWYKLLNFANPYDTIADEKLIQYPPRIDERKITDTNNMNDYINIQEDILIKYLKEKNYSELHKKMYSMKLYPQTIVRIVERCLKNKDMEGIKSIYYKDTPLPFLTSVYKYFDEINDKVAEEENEHIINSEDDEEIEQYDEYVDYPVNIRVINTNVLKFACIYPNKELLMILMQFIDIENLKYYFIELVENQARYKKIDKETLEEYKEIIKILSE